MGAHFQTESRMRSRTLTLFALASLLTIGCAARAPESAEAASASTCAKLDWSQCEQVRGCAPGSAVDADGTYVFRCTSRFNDPGSALGTQAVMLGALASQGR